MRWLRDRIHGRRPNQRPEEPTGEQRSPEPPAQKPAPDFELPRLVLLVRDAAGPASYQLHTFEDEAEAAAFVQFWFPDETHHGVIAFWASHKEPEVRTDESPAEVVVLVRDESRPKTVYPFSFAGMDLAKAWVERETDLGLDMNQVLIYWAVPTRISRDHWGQVRLWPSEPPTLRPQGRLATPTKPVFERDPQSRRDEARAPENEEAPSEEHLEIPTEPEGSVGGEDPAQAVNPPVKAIAAEEPAEEDTAVELLPETPPEAMTATETAQEPPAEQALDIEAAPELLPETSPETSVTDEASAAPQRPAPLKQRKPRNTNQPFDPGEETDKLLSRSGWEQRRGKFQGFGSPPGKF